MARSGGEGITRAALKWGTWLTGITAGRLPSWDQIAATVPLIPPAPLASSTGVVTSHYIPAQLSPATPLATLLGAEKEEVKAEAVVVSTNSPPIPGKIAQKIWRGECIELESLLPSRLGLPEPTLRDLMCGEKKKEKKGLTTIQEWVCCFNIYMAVILMKQPGRAMDLLAYSSLIVKASMDYEGEAWLGYDRFYCRQAAAEPARFPRWGEINPSIWTQQFNLAVARPACEDCGSREHKQCSMPRVAAGTSRAKKWERRPRPYSARKPVEICKRWNWGKCDQESCRFRHVCLECEGDHRSSTCGRRQASGKEDKGKQKAGGGSRKEDAFRAKR